MSAVENVVSQQALIDRLSDRLGEGSVLGPGLAASAYTVGGHAPIAVVYPRSYDEVGAVVSLAREAGQPIVPWGGGTNQELGPPLARPGVVLSLERMRALLDLDSGNMTAEVEGGMINQELQGQLALERLFFPIDPTDRQHSTIGGNIATNASGPSRLRYRSLRDHLMGISVILSTGELATFGGKTVKNVAGYDLRKLMIGSFGTLGVITSAIVRLWPIPEAKRTLIARLPNEDSFAEFSRRLLGSYLLPTSFERLDARAGEALAGELGWHLSPGEILCMVGVDGFQEAVDRQSREAGEMLSAAGSPEVECLEGDCEERAWSHRMAVEQSVAEGRAAVMVGRGSLPIDRVGEFFVLVSEMESQCSLPMAAVAHAGNGIVLTYILMDDMSEQTIASSAGAAAGLRRGAVRLGGFFRVEKAPPPLRGETAIWPKRSDYALMRAVKARLDPDGLLNPGRGVDGACEDA